MDRHKVPDLLLIQVPERLLPQLLLSSVFIFLTVQLEVCRNITVTQVNVHFYFESTLKVLLQKILLNTRELQHISRSNLTTARPTASQPLPS